MIIVGRRMLPFVYLIGSATNPNGAEATTDTIREVLSLLAEEGGIFEEEEGEEEFDSPHLVIRPGIQPAIATHSLLLEVLGLSEEGGDDTTECVALRSAIIRRVEFLANAMAEEDMNLEETYSSWSSMRATGIGRIRIG